MRCRAADTPIPRDDPFQNDIPTQLTGQPVPTDFDRQQGVTKLFRRSLIASFALLVTACVPIPPESVIVATPTPERELDVMQCPGGRIDLFPGQSAHDPLQLHLPDYLDIVGVESSLDGETLTAILHLRNVPEELEFNRTGLDNSSVEYKWAVDINIDNAGDPRDFSHEYTLEAFHVVNRIPRNAPPKVQPFKEAVEIKLLKITYYPERNESSGSEVSSANARLLVSHEQNTLTLIGQVPGITDESTLYFQTQDYLKTIQREGFPVTDIDDVSCLPLTPRSAP